MVRDPKSDLDPDRRFERQLHRLAPQLRDRGQTPQRDLWPGVAAAIDGIENRRPRLRRPRMWRIVSLAASVLLLLGAGLVGRVSLDAENRALAPGMVAQATVLNGPAALRAGLDEVDHALGDLQAAWRESPNDTRLSRLILKVHQSRGRLLRNQAQESVRDGRVAGY